MNKEQLRAIDEAELNIKRIVLRSIVLGLCFAETNKRIMQTVNRCVNSITSKTIKAMCQEQLNVFASKVYIACMKMFGKGEMLANTVKIAQKKGIRTPLGNTPMSYNRATANQTYSLNYEKEVKKRIEELSKMTAKPDYSTNYSLRATAERQLRYEWQEEQIETIKASGNNFVWIDTHENCSERCQKWQGQLYSLDHTTGTIDGIKFVPLEEATDIYETTKAGKTYKNGCLSGFNCRHKVIPYEKNGKKPVPIKSSVIDKERQLESQQRYMERTIRQHKTKALLSKDIGNKRLYAHYKELANKWINDYKEFSRANKIPFYEERIKI